MISGRYWLVTHTHRFGTGSVVIQHNAQPGIDLVERYATLVLDYEPDREDEWVEVEEVSVLTMEYLRRIVELKEKETPHGA